MFMAPALDAVRAPVSNLLHHHVGILEQHLVGPAKHGDVGEPRFLWICFLRLGCLGQAENSSRMKAIVLRIPLMLLLPPLHEGTH